MLPEPDSAAGAATEATEDPATLRESVVGYVEVLGETRVAGWAWCRGRPEKPVEVEIRLGDGVLQRVRADRFRQDLVRAGVGDGRHGFNVVFDEPLSRERKGDLRAFIVCGPDGPYVPLASPAGKPAAQASKNDIAEGSREAAETSLQAILTAIPDLQKSIDERLQAVTGNIRSALTQLAAEAKLAGRTIEAKCDDLRSTQASLERHISSLEVFQARLDAALAIIQERGGQAVPSRGEARRLVIFVSILAFVSTASLILGLISVFR